VKGQTASAKMQLLMASQCHCKSEQIVFLLLQASLLEMDHAHRNERPHESLEILEKEIVWLDQNTDQCFGLVRKVYCWHLRVKWVNGGGC